MGLADHIARFETYFLQQMETIEQLRSRVTSDVTSNQEDYQIADYKKVLFTTIIDTFAGIRFSRTLEPELHERNRARFIRFVREFGNWGYGELISLPLLLEHLQERNLLPDVVQLIQSKLATFNVGRGTSIELTTVDEPLATLLITNSRRRRETISAFQHCNILYKYLNYLVHEFRPLGYGMDVMSSDGVTPCYHRYGSDPELHLVYPVGMFKQIATTCLSNLKNYLLEHQLDPYDFVIRSTSIISRR